MSETQSTRDHIAWSSMLLTASVAAGAIGMTLARIAHYGALVTPLMLVASTSFVALGVASGALRSGFGRLTLAGLVCCWTGDVAGPHNFLAGLAAILVGQLFFAASFVRHGVVPRRAAFAFVIVAFVSGLIGVLFWPHVPAGERLPFAAYCAVISIMLITAAAARPGLPLAVPAAAIFYVSDVCVALWRYAGSAVDGYLCYLLYYTACALFALNVRYAAACLPSTRH